MSSDATQEFAFRLPDPGEGLTEAEIVEWYHDEGDDVEEDEPLVDVETDKAVVEMPTPCTGTLEEIRAEPGDIVEVGEVIAVFTTENPPRQQATDRSRAEASADESVAMDDGDDEPTSAITRVSESAGGGEAAAAGTGAESSAEAGAAEDTVFAAPSTRRYAREQGVDLAAVEDSGPGGRVLQEDVDRHLETVGAAAAPEADRGAGATEIGTESAPDDDVVVEPLRGLRRTIAENMQQSASEIPHVTSGFEADASALVDLKERLDDKHEDVRITYTAILVKAVVPALKAFPLVNASIDMDADEITKYNYYNIGVATHTDDGLIVPVVKRVDEKSIVEVAETLDEKVEAAREREIPHEDLQGGTFTITNTGSHGGHGTFGTPIIRHPEAAILGVGAIDEKPVAVDGELTIQKRIGFSFSYDHRLVDGVTAGQFMERVIEGIEDPDLLLARL